VNVESARLNFGTTIEAEGPAQSILHRKTGSPIGRSWNLRLSFGCKKTETTEKTKGYRVFIRATLGGVEMGILELFRRFFLTCMNLSRRTKGTPIVPGFVFR